MTAYTVKDSNIRKTWALVTLFFAGVIGLGWVFSYIYHDQAILVFAVLLSVVMNIGAYWYSDKVALAVARAVPADPVRYHELHNIVENLAITAGLPKPAVYIINDPSPNAFATGRDPQHASIAFTTGIVERLNKVEIEGVAAHELSHVKNYDILLSTVVVVLVGVVSLATDFFLRSMWFRGNRDDRNNGGGILMLVGIALAILAPIFATLVQLAISRKRESLADASGVLLTRYPDGLADALEKIEAAEPMRHPTNATAHLFIANPFKADTPRVARKTPWLAKLFMTHPPIEERIAALRAMDRPHA
jgi:heat shock protein HtpX